MADAGWNELPLVLRSPLLPFTPPQLVSLPKSTRSDSPGKGVPVLLSPAPFERVLPPARRRRSVHQSCSLCTFASPAPTRPFFATAPWEGCRCETSVRTRVSDPRWTGPRPVPTSPFKLFRRHAISRCATAGCDRSLLLPLSPVSWSAACSDLASLQRGGRPSRFGPPASGN